MRIRDLILGSTGLLMLASCSSDELVGVNHNGDEISYNVVTNAGTRYAELGYPYSNDMLPGSFHLWAKSDGKDFIQGDHIIREENKWVDTFGTHYWPNDASVTFFAVVDAEDEFVWLDGAPKLEDVEVPNDALQKDIMYAVKTASKPASGGQVTLNFRHALSQITYAARCTNPDIIVKIEGITVCNLGNKNTFTFGTGDTENKDGQDESAGWGTWAPLTGGSTNYEVEIMSPIEVHNYPESSSSTPLTTSSSSFVVLPQNTTGWKVTDGKKPAEQTGTYFLVKCSIWNCVNGEGMISDDSVCLWGGENGEAMEIAIPADLNLLQGRKHIFTFVFGDGGGGYDPEDPTKPVLVPITYDVTVEDFKPAPTEIVLPAE